MKRRKGKDILDLEIRRMIYNFILKNPGLHERELSRQLKIPKTTMNYHLNYLQKQDLIVSINEKRYLRFYIKQRVGFVDKQILSIIRQEVPRRIILFLFAYPERSRIEISRDLEKSDTTISFHLKKMLKKDIIICYRLGHKLVYKLKNQVDIYKFLITYEESLAEDILICNLLDWFKFSSPSGKHIRDPRRKKSDIEDVEDIILDIFPHPYYL